MREEHIPWADEPDAADKWVMEVWNEAERSSDSFDGAAILANERCNEQILRHLLLIEQRLELLSP